MAKRKEPQGIIVEIPSGTEPEFIADGWIEAMRKILDETVDHSLEALHENEVEWKITECLIHFAGRLGRLHPKMSETVLFGSVDFIVDAVIETRDVRAFKAFQIKLRQYQDRLRKEVSAAKKKTRAKKGGLR